MAVTIQHGNDQATFDNGRWSSADPRLEAFLNSTIPTDEISPSVGRPDLFVARNAVRRLGDGATIVTVSPERLPPDAIA